MAIEAGLDKDVVRTVGRWRSAETHYVHAKPSKGFTAFRLNFSS